ncbi:SAGA associated factor 11kDa isoform X2 [Oratosquilla oratoria]|uniref:SAGA associated factor 11kDa isoform X2 n=1 Tax=Oratosquilla oratoria TaxID=337810 RepID=UPI003F7639B6
MTKEATRGKGNSSSNSMVAASGGETFVPWNLDSTTRAALATPDLLEMASQNLFKELIDDAILAVVFEVHRSLKRGLLALEIGTPEDQQRYLQVTTEGLDVFGQVPAKKQQDCACPNCSRNLAASRFAPHLEKCMGMGRNSSRIASRRIQNSTKENTTNHLGSDDDDDDDWYIDRKRKKRDRNSPRRSKNIKVKSESVSSSNNTIDSLSAGTMEDKRHMLGQICGVVSEHTRKMCTRSLRCPQHTSEQRKAIRDQIYGSESTMRAADSTSRSLTDSEEVHVDIDSLDDGINTLTTWDNDHSNTTSPADSTSTNNSTSSNLNKRNSGSKSKKKSSKSSKSSNSSHGSLLD